MRVAITGAPGTGKTTLSSTYRAVRPSAICHADDYLERGREAASQVISELFDDPSYDTWEGVHLPFAIRRWLDRHKHDLVRPFDMLIVLTQQRCSVTARQLSVWRMYDNTLQRCIPSLIRRGVRVDVR